jgi:hypothetical protein
MEAHAAIPLERAYVEAVAGRAVGATHITLPPPLPDSSEVLVSTDNPALLSGVRYALVHAGIVAIVRDSMTLIAYAHLPTVAPVHGVMSGPAVTCPLCHEEFVVPSDSEGALMDCPACPWRGAVGIFPYDMEES